MDNRHSGPAVVAGDGGDSPGRGKLDEREMEASDISLQDRMKWPEQSVVKKVETLQLLMSYLLFVNLDEQFSIFDPPLYYFLFLIL